MTKKKPPANPVLPVQPDRRTGHVHLFLNKGDYWECECGETK